MGASHTSHLPTPTRIGDQATLRRAADDVNRQDPSVAQKAFQQAEARAYNKKHAYNQNPSCLAPPIPRPVPLTRATSSDASRAGTVRDVRMKITKRVKEIFIERIGRKVVLESLCPLITVTQANRSWEGLKGVYTISGSFNGQNMYKNILTNATIKFDGGRWRLTFDDASCACFVSEPTEDSVPVGAWVHTTEQCIVGVSWAESYVNIAIATDEDMAGVPIDGFRVRMREVAPLKLLVDTLARNLQVRPEVVALCHEGKSLRLEKSLKDNCVSLPRASMRDKSVVDISLHVSGLPETMRKAIEDYMKHPTMKLDSILLGRFFGEAAAADDPHDVKVNYSEDRGGVLGDQLAAADDADDPLDVKVSYSEDWGGVLGNRLRRLTALTNTTVQDLMMSDSVVVQTAQKQEITFSSLCHKAGDDLRQCFPISVTFRPTVGGRRVKAPDEVKLVIEQLMNAAARGGRKFDVECVLINRNDKLWQRADLNEHMLFHGTEIDSAAAIAGASFNLELANQGAFGRGIYFADSPVKSHAYTQRSPDGLHTMLLCRVACGNLKSVRVTGDYGPHVLAPNSNFHGVTGTCFRHPEFIVYREEQCYPEYVILYK